MRIILLLYLHTPLLSLYAVSLIDRLLLEGPGITFTSSSTNVGLCAVDVDAIG